MKSFSVGQLAVWLHPAEGEAIARVMMVHGICEHSGRHLNTIQALNKLGYEVVRFDLRGAGRSGGIRQYVEGFADYVQDCVQVYTWICRELSHLPLFVLGHSLGGLIAIYFASHYSKALQGLILTAPAYKVGEGVSAFKIAAGRILNRLLPKLRMPEGIGAPVSRDLKVCQDYKSDPLCCHTNTVKQGVEILNAMEVLPEIAAQVSCPVMIIHGTHDRIILPVGSFDILKHFASKEKTLHFIPEGFHELHNDLCKEQFFPLLGIWIQRHLKKRK